MWTLARLARCRDDQADGLPLTRSLQSRNKVWAEPAVNGIFDKFTMVRLIEGTLSAESERLDGLSPPATFSIGDG